MGEDKQMRFKEKGDDIKIKIIKTIIPKLKPLKEPYLSQYFAYLDFIHNKIIDARYMKLI